MTSGSFRCLWFMLHLYISQTAPDIWTQVWVRCSPRFGWQRSSLFKSTALTEQLHQSSLTLSIFFFFFITACSKSTPSIRDMRCMIMNLYTTVIPPSEALSLVWSLAEWMSDSLLPALSVGTEDKPDLTSHCAILLEIHAEYKPLQFTLMSQMLVTVFCSFSHQKYHSGN